MRLSTDQRFDAFTPRASDNVSLTTLRWRNGLYSRLRSERNLLKFAAFFHPSTAIRSQLTGGSGVVELELVGVQDFTPAAIGAFEEEGVGATIKIGLRSRGQLCAAIPHFRAGAVADDPPQHLAGRCYIERARDPLDPALDDVA